MKVRYTVMSLLMIQVGAQAYFALAPDSWSRQQATQVKLGTAWVTQQPQQFAVARNLAEQVGNLVRFNTDLKKQLYLLQVFITVDANGQLTTLSFEPEPLDAADKVLLGNLEYAVKKVYNDYVPQRDPLMQPI